MIDVYDNVLEDHVAEFVDMEIKKLAWWYDYSSVAGKPNKHWHIMAGDSVKDLEDSPYAFLLFILNAAFHKYNFKEKYKIEVFQRAYMNAHTHGIEPHLHMDDGSYTMIYYPRLDWQREWEGGTIIYGKPISEKWDDPEIEKHVKYKGNRLIVFPAKRPHQALPVSRQCYKLRTCIVFKTWVEGGTKETVAMFEKSIAEGKYKIKWE